MRNESVGTPLSGTLGCSPPLDCTVVVANEGRSHLRKVCATSRRTYRIAQLQIRSRLWGGHRKVAAIWIA
jgi:hypothetical protein